MEWLARQRVEAVLRFVRQYPAAERHCSVCGHVGSFVPFGRDVLRPAARCPACESLDRHRLLALWLRGQRSLGRVLHFAPEACLRPLLEQRSETYRTGDLRVGRAEMVLDLQRLEVDSASIDTIICNHVLEHVDDDAAALGEFWRTLTPGGRCILMVPIVEGWQHTEENPDLGPLERTLAFGQSDHVRLYGADFRDRVRCAGFELEEFTAVEPAVSRYALVPGEKVFIATRTPAGRRNGP